MRLIAVTCGTAQETKWQHAQIPAFCTAAFQIGWAADWIYPQIK
jgi:hypothetical protein